MSTPIEPQDEPKRNTLAIASLILGALSVAFAQFCAMPGNISVVGCLGGILAIAAAVTGVLGIRAAQEGQGKRSAIGGIFTAAIGLAVFLFVFIPAMVTPGGLWTYVQATPTPTITPTPTMTPTPTITPTVTPEPTSTPAPQTHYGDSFAITFTDEWEVYRDIREPEQEDLIIEHPEGILLRVLRYTLSEKPDVESETDAFLFNSFGSINLIAEGEIEIGGQKGLTKRFVFQDSRGQSSHMLLAGVANEYDLYFILVYALSQETFTRYQAETEAIIASITFTTEGAPAPTPAIESTPPTSTLPTDVPEDFTFTGDGFTLTHPGDWVEFDSSGSTRCQRPGTVCLFLFHASEDGTEFLLIREPLEEDATVEEIDQSLWNQYADAGAELISQDAVEIDGRPGIKRAFSFSTSSSPTGEIFVLQVLIVNGNDLYQFSVTTTSATLLMKHQSAAEGIIDSLKFTE